jgi:hypothetical protein
VWLWGELTGSRERGMYYREEYNSDKYRGGCLFSASYEQNNEMVDKEAVFLQQSISFAHTLLAAVYHEFPF